VDRPGLVLHWFYRSGHLTWWPTVVGVAFIFAAV